MVSTRNRLVIHVEKEISAPFLYKDFCDVTQKRYSSKTVVTFEEHRK